MTPTTRLTERADTLGLPWDFTEWFEKEQLLQWITADVETLEWEDPNLIAFLRAHTEFRPKTLLSLLTYAYATGMFGSDEIVSGCYEDKTLRSICNGLAPTRHEISAFRRENRGLLRWFLVELFKRALNSKFGDFLMPAGLKQRLIEAAAARLDVARHMDSSA